MTLFVVGMTPDELYLLGCLREIAGMAETGRSSVSEIGAAIRQIDVDAASAVTRGSFMSIADFATTAVARVTKNRS